MHESLAVTCGQLIIGGFQGTALSPTYARALERGERGGAILFRRNLPQGLEALAHLNATIVAASRADLSPLIGVDQEGGRVARIGLPALRVPPMQTLAKLGDEAFAERVATAMGTELATLGFTTSFAPVLDVHSHPNNPVIGDRSFGTNADVVARYGVAFCAGLRKAGVFACGKHFPGHGDTHVDSHFDLPVIDHDRARLDAIELVPFRAAALAGIESLMTAHVVVSKIDPEVPATLSRTICTELLRGELAFRGVLISDDLEMKAVADRYPVEESAVLAVAAGCDLLLICSDEALQTRAHEALVLRAEKDSTFRMRCEEAFTRSLELRKRFPPRPSPANVGRVVGGQESLAIARELDLRSAS
ncbi:MAG: beta-N-acetylhexosaminidase [Polyangiaceae bacterium]